MPVRELGMSSESNVKIYQNENKHLFIYLLNDSDEEHLT